MQTQMTQIERQNAIIHELGHAWMVVGFNVLAGTNYVIHIDIDRRDGRDGNIETTPELSDKHLLMMLPGGACAERLFGADPRTVELGAADDMTALRCCFSDQVIDELFRTTYDSFFAAADAEPEFRQFVTKFLPMLEKENRLTITPAMVTEFSE